jgi:hypothetical protein
LTDKNKSIRFSQAKQYFVLFYCFNLLAKSVSLYADPFEYTNKTYGFYIVILKTTIYTVGNNWFT